MTGRTFRGVILGVAVLATTAATSACTSPPERDDALTAASAFAVAVVNDPAQACRLLAPPTLEAVEEDGDCAGVLGSAPWPDPMAGDTPDVVVAGHTARVATGADTIFLARYDDGWKVMAAGCEKASSDRAEPYDCTVKDD